MDLSFFNDHLSNPATLIPAILKECQGYYEYKAFKEYEPEHHRINDPALRPDKLIYEDTGQMDNDGNPITRAVVSPVTRIALAIQKLIVSRQVAFITGGDTALVAIAARGEQQKLFDVVQQTWRKNKLDYKNSNIAKAVLSQLECAEIWYSEKGEDDKVRMRVRFYTPSDGYDLIPVWDAYGDLIAFGLQYEDVKVKKERYLDLYTAESRTKYVQKGGGWELKPSEPDAPNPLPLPYGKIPVIYYSQPKSAWADVQSLIERLEKLLSGFGDTNDYNGSPILFSNTEIESLPKKGEAGKFVKAVDTTGEVPASNARLEYVAWDAKPEAVIFEKDTLIELIYSITQTPNISFEAMKSLGDISGVAFDRIFLDAHLKARDAHNSWYGEGIQRRLNFLIAACAEATPGMSGAKDLEIAPQFGIFKIDPDGDRITRAMQANGGLPIMSHETSITYANISEDAAAEMEKIAAEKEAKAIPPASPDSTTNTAAA